MRAFILLMLTTLSAQLTIAQQDFSDCIFAVKVCDKESVLFEKLPDAGTNIEEIGTVSCYAKPFPETNSAWVKWTVREAGTLEFSVIPIDEKDDFDFVLYRTNSDENLCDNRTEIRCMTSGENVGEDLAFNCLGVTGIRVGAGDENEQAGCTDGDDNFLEGLEVRAGETYVLAVNNISSNGGFMLEFFGDAEFETLGCTSGTSTYNGLKEGIIVSDIYPNPSASEIRTDITMPEQGEGAVYVFDATGRLKYNSVHRFMPGLQNIAVDISDYSPGMYFLKIKVGEDYYITNFTKQ